MVEVYNARANTQGLEPYEMRTVGSLAELHQQRFDLAMMRASFSFLRLRFFLTLITDRFACLVLDGVPPLCLGQRRHTRARRMFEAARHARRRRHFARGGGRG